jgi:thiosulfate/3-mercaptopyruvate sulfurtransferase
LFVIRSHAVGARRFDVDTICDRGTSLPHMLPPLAQFEEQVTALGISNESIVVCYDSNQQYMGSARVWWTFKVHWETLASFFFLPFFVLVLF